jgi:hypothetical protein
MLLNAKSTETDPMIRFQQENPTQQPSLCKYVWYDKNTAEVKCYNITYDVNVGVDCCCTNELLMTFFDFKQPKELDAVVKNELNTRDEPVDFHGVVKRDKLDNLINKGLPESITVNSEVCPLFEIGVNIDVPLVFGGRNCFYHGFDKKNHQIEVKYAIPNSENKHRIVINIHLHHSAVSIEEGVHVLNTAISDATNRIQRREVEIEQAKVVTLEVNGQCNSDKYSIAGNSNKYLSQVVQAMQRQQHQNADEHQPIAAAAASASVFGTL